MDLTSLRAVLNDLKPQLLPSRFEKAQQPDGTTLQLGFRSLRGCESETVGGFAGSFDGYDCAYVVAAEGGVRRSRVLV